MPATRFPASPPENHKPEQQRRGPPVSSPPQFSRAIRRFPSHRFDSVLTSRSAFVDSVCMSLSSVAPPAVGLVLVSNTVARCPRSLGPDSGSTSEHRPFCGPAARKSLRDQLRPAAVFCLIYHRLSMPSTQLRVVESSSIASRPDWCLADGNDDFAVPPPVSFPSRRQCNDHQPPCQTAETSPAYPPCCASTLCFPRTALCLGHVYQFTCPEPA